MLRSVGMLAAGLALGFALGGVPARREKQAIEQENAELREQLRSGSQSGLLRMLLSPRAQDLEAALEVDRPRDDAAGAQPAAPAAGAQGRRDAPQPEHNPRERGDVTVVGADEPAARAAAGARAADAEGASAPGAQPPRTQAGSDDSADRRGLQNLTRERVNQFVSAQSARAAASRATLVESAHLSGAQVERLDGTLERTNQKLEGYGEEVIANAARGTEPEPAEALSFTRDVAEILHEGQTEVDAIVQESGAEVPEESTQIWNLVSPEGLKETAAELLPSEDGENVPPPVLGRAPRRDAGAATGGPAP